MGIDVVLVRTDDWEILYINNVLKTDGHSLSLEDVFEKIKFKAIMCFKSYYIDGDKFEDKYSSNAPEFFNQFDLRDFEK